MPAQGLFCERNKTNFFNVSSPRARPPVASPQPPCPGAPAERRLTHSRGRAVLATPLRSEEASQQPRQRPDLAAFGVGLVLLWTGGSAFVERPGDSRSLRGVKLFCLTVVCKAPKVWSVLSRDCQTASARTTWRGTRFWLLCPLGTKLLRSSALPSLNSSENQDDLKGSARAIKSGRVCSGLPVFTAGQTSLRLGLTPAAAGFKFVQNARAFILEVSFSQKYLPVPKVLKFQAGPFSLGTRWGGGLLGSAGRSSREGTAHCRHRQRLFQGRESSSRAKSRCSPERSLWKELLGVEREKGGV